MKKLLGLGLLISALSFGHFAQAQNGPLNCYIQAFDGHYMTAVGGGGRTSDVIHTNAVNASTWERFTLIDSNSGTPNITYGIRTYRGYYLTAVDGGGRIQNVMRSNETQLRDWEKFQLESLGNGYYAIKTYTGNYVTAVNSGGLSTQVADVLHTDAKRVGSWEKFRFRCGGF